MKTKKLIALALSMVMIIATLTGCKGNDEKTSENPTPTNSATKAPDATDTPDPTDEPSDDTNKNIDAANEGNSKFATVATNTDPSIDGGVLKVALTSESPFAGCMNICFYSDNYDAQILGWFYEGLLTADENFVYDNEGAATYTYDIEAKTMTLTMKPGVKWHDGEQVTLDDLVFAHEVIAHPDYVGMRYDESIYNIVGVEAYHNGEADTISGLELSEDEMTLTIHFIDFYPSILVGGIWQYPLPRHYFEGIAVKDMESHEKSRTIPIGFGPFKFVNTVPGESVKFERYDDYWMGRPKLDGVEVQLISTSLVPIAMQEGKFDVAEFTAQDYPNYIEPSNYEYLGLLQTAFNYTGFKLGKWDAENNTNIYDPDSKMANLKLRQAIGYAIDNNEIGESMYNGLRYLATTVITPRHASYQNKSLTGYDYNPEKSKQLLDEAGYIDIDGDGYREDPDGNQFTITWAHMDGAGADTISQYKIQLWAAVGLRVELYNGRLTEFNAFYDAVEYDDPAIDMYDGAWQTGWDPNPSALWGRNSSANYTRYTSETFDAIQADISSDKAWDNDFLDERYNTWQQAFFDECPAIPTIWRMVLEAVNNRVKNYTIRNGSNHNTLHLIELTADAPYVK